MKVSIITSVWNNKDTIEDAILSVLSQTYRDIEYIIIDGGSTDGTLDILNKYKDKISVLVSERDSGIYEGLNKGLFRATGEVVAFLHSDDIYACSKTIETIVRAFTHGVDGVYSDLVYTSKNDLNKIVRYWKSSKISKYSLKLGWMPPHPSIFLKKTVYQRYGCFDQTFKIAADYDLILRIFGRDLNFVYLPITTYKMRLGGASNKSIKHLLEKSQEDLRALKKNEVGGILTLILKNLSKLSQFWAL